MVIPQSAILIIAIFSIFIIGWIDYLIIIDLSLSICYLIPIIIVTRYVNKKVGILLSILSAISWYIAESVAKVELHSFLLLWNTMVRLTVFLIVIYLVSNLRNAYEQEKKLARIDGLTKIYNRRYFVDILKIESKRAIRYQRCLTLVYFDVDNFKAVNDRLGHAQGDKLLCLIAQIVQIAIRKSDIVARFGGDEFALLLPETDYQEAQVVLKRIQQQLLAAAQANAFNVGFSMGAITFTDLPDSIDAMLEQVDNLMYQVKHHGKNSLNHKLYQLP